MYNDTKLIYILYILYIIDFYKIFIKKIIVIFFYFLRCLYRRLACSKEEWQSLYWRRVFLMKFTNYRKIIKDCLVIDCIDFYYLLRTKYCSNLMIIVIKLMCGAIFRLLHKNKFYKYKNYLALSVILLDLFF